MFYWISSNSRNNHIIKSFISNSVRITITIYTEKGFLECLIQISIRAQYNLYIMLIIYAISRIYSPYEIKKVYQGGNCNCNCLLKMSPNGTNARQITIITSLGTYSVKFDFTYIGRVNRVCLYYNLINHWEELIVGCSLLKITETK